MRHLSVVRLDKLKLLIFTLLLFTCLGQVVQAKPRIPGLLQIPTADILPHGLFNISSRANLFEVIDSDSTDEFKYPVGHAVIMGLSNMAQIGIHYGNEPSLSFKAYLYEAESMSFYPDVVIGARSLFGSQEAWLHGVESLSERRALRNEAYLAFSSTINENTRVHLGASSIPGNGNPKAEGFAGIEQFFGKGIYVGYEVFHRLESLHHNISLVYKVESYFSISLGLTEFQSWVSQEGQVGFYTSSEEPEFFAYDVPGISLAISLGGWAMRDDKKTRKEKIRDIEKEQSRLKNEVKKYT